MSFASTITGVPVGFNKILNTSVWANTVNPYFLPNTPEDQIAVSSINAPVITGVSTINGSPYYPVNNLWQTQSKTITGSALTATNISTVAVQYTAGSLGTTIALPKGIYDIQTLARIGNNGGLFDTIDSDLTTYMKFSTGTNVVYGSGLVRCLSTNINTAYIPFEGVLDCPVDNAPLQFFALTPGLVNQSILSGDTSAGRLIIQYAKLDSTT